MEFDILDALDDLGNPFHSSLNIIERKQRCNLPNGENFACLRYCGVLKSDDEIVRAIEGGTKSIEFIELVQWLSKELQCLNAMESCISAVTDVEDSSSFSVEVSSFLKELNCPYQSLVNGPISQRLIDVQSRRTLVDYLCTELLTARLLHAKRKKVKNALDIEMDDSATAVSLLGALEALDIGGAVGVHGCSDPAAFFTQIESKVRTLLESEARAVPPPILFETLSEKQWESLASLYSEFLADYTVRRKLLLTRLDVTIQSFRWGENSKGKENKIAEAYLSRSKKLKALPAVKLSDAMAAREDLLIVEKTSSASLVKNTKSSVNTVVIPPVPDRGGRPKEQRPPVEMPSWSKRSQGGGRGDHHGGGNWRGKNKKFRGKQNSGY